MYGIEFFPILIFFFWKMKSTENWNSMHNKWLVKGVVNGEFLRFFYESASNTKSAIFGTSKMSLWREFALVFAWACAIYYSFQHLFYVLEMFDDHYSSRKSNKEDEKQQQQQEPKQYQTFSFQKRHTFYCCLMAIKSIRKGTNWFAKEIEEKK